MESLYKLRADYRDVYNIDDIDVDLWLDTLESIQADIEVKADNYVKIILEEEANADKYKKQEAIFAEKRKVCENKVARLKKRLYETMNELEMKEIPNELFKIKIQANGGVAPLIIREGATIPEEYQIVKTDINNDAIRKALKTQELDFAYLGERGTHLVIK